MVLRHGEILRCPQCGGKEFCATAHITQDWELDDGGSFVKSLNDCVEVTHFPDSEDIWGCKRCGYSDAGSTFIVRENETK